ncbi:hypothetical protein AXG93_2727s1250 [Marchantia polymorpha subsp. ruderalis]|uniref:Uncharacterized protein n=1 Tax=Marchantia polymorpha subsp. ruderalis TaxID=1480154 RepID=A0A176VBS1_MARPO|nr:hypothetical protein AXG93_2727s1250 [Marchantia polymorpha subsp. ruderalis]
MRISASVEVGVVESARVQAQQLAQLVPVPAAVLLALLVAARGEMLVAYLRLAPSLSSSGELRRRVRDATLMSDASPTLAHVFALSEKIELNMVEERVVTSTFARGRDGDAPRGRVGRGGKGTGAIERTVATATSATERAMAARIEQLEQRLAPMAGLGASTSTSYEAEDFSYLASAAQVEASVVVSKGGARTLEPHVATMELDPSED